MPLEQRVSSPHLCNTTWSRLERLIHHVLNVPPLNSAIPKPNIFGYRALVPSSVSVLNTFWKLLWGRWGHEIVWDRLGDSLTAHPSPLPSVLQDYLPGPGVWVPELLG